MQPDTSLVVSGIRKPRGATQQRGVVANVRQHLARVATWKEPLEGEPCRAERDSSGLGSGVALAEFECYRLFWYKYVLKMPNYPQKPPQQYQHILQQSPGAFQCSLMLQVCASQIGKLQFTHRGGSEQWCQPVHEQCGQHALCTLAASKMLHQTDGIGILADFQPDTTLVPMVTCILDEATVGTPQGLPSSMLHHAQRLTGSRRMDAVVCSVCKFTSHTLLGGGSCSNPWKVTMQQFTGREHSIALVMSHVF